jgi:glycosyltransferase involved in cell wall biosynthesis
MPNYNDAAFIGEALESVLNQSYETFEIVLVDDGSTDDSFALVSDYGRRDSRMRIYRNEKNSGVVFTINRAESLAKGTYVYFLSSNDKALPGFFQKSVEALEAHPKSGLAWTDPSHFFEPGGPIYRRKTGLTPQAAYLSPEDLCGMYASGALSAPFHAAPALFRRSVYQEAGGLIPELRWYCDFFMTLVCAFRTGICYIPEALTSTRMLQKSYWRTGSAQKQLQRDLFTLMLDLLLSDRFADVAPLVRRSGVLSYFGLPIFNLARKNPEYRKVLDRRYFRRGLWFSAKHEVRKLASLPFQRLYFKARQAVRSKNGSD